MWDGDVAGDPFIVLESLHNGLGCRCLDTLSSSSEPSDELPRREEESAQAADEGQDAASYHP